MQLDRMDSATNRHVLNLGNISPNIKNIQYAVRGPLVMRALELIRALANKSEKKPFSQVILANAGDAQAFGQKPITFVRQVLSLICYPDLMTDNRFPEDVKERARSILNACRGQTIGCYTENGGLQLVRKHIAEFIERRDGFPSRMEDIFICAGASEGLRSILKMLSTISQPRTGIMIPIPQYPLYSASLTEYNMEQVDYYLNEDNNWALDIDELERAICQARDRCNVRGIVVINPGNPTGQVLTRKNIVEVIQFAVQNKLFILADEVYQNNVYADGSQFFSFKKVALEMGDPYDKVELASVMSASKGYVGECGSRAGYVEIINMDPEIKPIFLNFISTKFSASVSGQAIIECIVNPPKLGEPSYQLFAEEKKTVLDSLAERANLINQTINSILGIQCNLVQGAMYAFPRITIPEKAVAKAKCCGLEPDEFYANQLLETTGICVVPGSGFGQREGTYHIRMTTLPQKELVTVLMKNLASFHRQFTQEYQ